MVQKSGNPGSGFYVFSVVLRDFWTMNSNSFNNFNTPRLPRRELDCYAKVGGGRDSCLWGRVAFSNNHIEPTCDHLYSGFWMCSDKINDAVFWNRSLEDKFWRGSGNAKNRDEMIAFAETDKLRRSSCCVVLFPLIGAPSWNESDWVGGHRCSLWRCGICPAGRVSDYELYG